jgi:S-adenosylmethionine:tRNA ribosyltransferase-isomerase
MNHENGGLLNVEIDKIDYNLPVDRIARYPLEVRHDSKLLVYKKGNIYDGIFRDFRTFLPKNSLLVFNNTKVISARLLFQKSTGALIEIFCLEPYDPADYELAFAKTGSGKWKCLVGNLKKWKDEILEKEIQIGGKQIYFRARKLIDNLDSQIIEFEWTDENLCFSELLESAGETPIPPYLKRATEAIDHNRYQTIYAAIEGSVAAPTAGLHFTAEVFKTLQSKGIEKLNITLHVGAGTFRPVHDNSVKNHIMHTEHFSLSKENIESLLKFEGNIIAVGTTSARTLESLYWCGVELLLKEDNDPQDMHVSQWEWTKISKRYSVSDSLNAILRHMNRAQISILKASTQLMILPGYKFNLIDGIVTNFHQPRSTLLLLIAAMTGDDWTKIYDHALSNNYRFLSYGDSSLLLKPRQREN